MIIEGIGFIYGLIQKSPGCIIDESSYEISCFSQNGKTLYPDTITNCNPLLTATEETDKDVLILNVNPSPTLGTVNISSKGKIQYSVYDIFGRHILQSQFPTFDLSPYPKGIYFVKIFSEGKAATRKIVLQ